MYRFEEHWEKYLLGKKGIPRIRFKFRGGEIRRFWGWESTFCFRFVKFHSSPLIKMERRRNFYLSAIWLIHVYHKTLLQIINHDPVFRGGKKKIFARFRFTTSRSQSFDSVFNLVVGSLHDRFAKFGARRNIWWNKNGRFFLRRRALLEDQLEGWRRHRRIHLRN